MCQKKPGPRCASHVRNELLDARRHKTHMEAFGRENDKEEAAAKYAKVRREFYKTPTGQRELAAIIDNSTDAKERRQLSNLLAELKLERKAESLAGRLADMSESAVIAEREAEESRKKEPPEGEYYDSTSFTAIAEEHERARVEGYDETLLEKTQQYVAEVEELAKKARQKKDLKAMGRYGRDLRYVSDTMLARVPDDKFPSEKLRRELWFLRGTMSHKGISIYGDADRRKEKRARDISDRERYWEQKVSKVRDEVNVEEIKRELVETARRKASRTEGVKRTDFPFTLGHDFPAGSTA